MTGNMEPSEWARKFDMTFHHLTTIELIVQANDHKALSQMDQGDLRAMIQELADRLEHAHYLAVAERKWME